MNGCFCPGGSGPKGLGDIANPFPLSYEGTVYLRRHFHYF